MDINKLYIVVFSGLSLFNHHLLFYSSPHHFATLTLLFLGIFSLCFPLISGLEINCANIFITPWLSPQILSEHRNAYLGLYFS